MSSRRYFMGSSCYFGVVNALCKYVYIESFDILFLGKMIYLQRSYKVMTNFWNLIKNPKVFHTLNTLFPYTQLLENIGFSLHMGCHLHIQNVKNGLFNGGCLFLCVKHLPCVCFHIDCTSHTRNLNCLHVQPKFFLWMSYLGKIYLMVSPFQVHANKISINAWYMDSPILHDKWNGFTNHIKIPIIQSGAKKT